MTETTQQPQVSPDGQWKWDGAQWVPNTPAAPAAAEAPEKKRRWPIFAVIGAVAFLWIGLAETGESSADSDDPAAAAAPAEAPSEEQAQAAAPAPAAPASGTITGTDRDYLNQLDYLAPGYVGNGYDDTMVSIGHTLCRDMDDISVFWGLDNMMNAAINSGVSMHVAGSMAAAATTTFCPWHATEVQAVANQLSR